MHQIWEGLLLKCFMQKNKECCCEVHTIILNFTQNDSETTILTDNDAYLYKNK